MTLTAHRRAEAQLVAHFGPADDILAEIETLKGWLIQSYVAVAPKRLGRLVTERRGDARE